jgi:hypothetical protein
MKLQLTKTAKQQLKKMYVKFDGLNVDYYSEKMNKRECLILDAMLYVGNAYVKNKFTKLDEWCISNNGEYDEEYLAKYPNAVKQKLGKMIMEDIITIVE